MPPKDRLLGKGLPFCRDVGMSASRQWIAAEGFLLKLLNSKKASCFVTFFISLNYPHEKLEIKERKVGTPFALMSSLPFVAMCHRNIESHSQEILT
jgi:threonine/homoserine/homoserine lactone efflux protein